MAKKLPEGLPSERLYESLQQQYGKGKTQEGAVTRAREFAKKDVYQKPSLMDKAIYYLLTKKKKKGKK